MRRPGAASTVWEIVELNHQQLEVSVKQAMAAVLLFLTVALSSQLCAAPPGSAELPGAETISSTDLKERFHTRSSWLFLIRQDPPQDRGAGDVVPGGLHFCFINGSNQNCSNAGFSFNALGSSQVEYSTPGSRQPILVVRLVDQYSATGGGRSTLIWTYNAATDQFEKVFDRVVSQNTNGEIRIVTDGPLAGDIVTAVAGGPPAYRYHITVYRLDKSGSRELLSYDGHSRYNDGNAMPVIDAEMPEIERRLGLWEPGDPLPVPVRTQCRSLEMKHGVEWCDQSSSSP
jgi:hypothetical protein